MLTYDSLTSEDDDPVKAMVRGKKPDVIEIGERNDCWMQVRRSKSVLELVDKVNGNIKATIPIDEHFQQVATDRHDLKERQIGAALAAMRL
jgi:hypothetical protein